MGEQFILKGGNNKKNNDNKKSGGSDKKKSGGSDKKKSGGSDKKSGGVNETLINMDMGGGGAILDNFMSQENATNGDGFLSGSSYSVTGGTMYKGGAGAETTLKEMLKNLIDEKRDDIINMLKLKFLSFTDKLNQTGEDVKTHINQLKELFINDSIEYNKEGLLRKKNVFDEKSKNPINNIIKELKNIINEIDINNLSKSNIGLFNFIDFDFVITKINKIENKDLLSRLYILRIIIKYINNEKKISFKEINILYNNYNEINTYETFDNNSMTSVTYNGNVKKEINIKNYILDKNVKPYIYYSSTSYIHIYYSSTSYIHNIHKLILYKNKFIDNDTISNNCAKIIYELLEKLSEEYNNEKVFIYEDIGDSQEPVLDNVTTFKETLKTIPTKDLLEVLTYLKKNIDRPEPPATAQGEAAAPEAAPEKKNIIKLLIDKVRECYDPCDTDNIYLNMSTKEFLKNIENYLIEIFNMENNEDFKEKLDNFIEEAKEKEAAEAAEAQRAAVERDAEANQIAAEAKQVQEAITTEIENSSSDLNDENKKIVESAKYIAEKAVEKAAAATAAATAAVTADAAKADAAATKATQEVKEARNLLNTAKDELEKVKEVTKAITPAAADAAP